MRKTITILLLLCCATVTFAQNNPRPSRSRFWLNKASTFEVKPGDILVYQVNNNGEAYNFIATVKSYGDKISFEYSVPEKKLNGNANIDTAAVKSAIKYNNIFINSEPPAKDKTEIWLSKDNYRGLAGNTRQTRMDFGSGSQSFKRETTSTQKILYKGKEKLMTIYKVASQGTTGRKELWVLNDLNNPLIVKMQGGSTISLKEVR